MVAKKTLVENVAPASNTVAVKAPKEKSSSSSKKTASKEEAPTKEKSVKAKKSSTATASKSEVVDTSVVDGSSVDSIAGGAAIVDGSSTAAVVTASERLAVFGTKLQQLSSVLSSLRTEFKAMDRAIAKEIRAAQKSSRRRNANAGNRQPIGFTKPTLISDELAGFLGLELGKAASRVEVCRMLYAYIKENKLQDPKNGREIIPDAALSKLLKIRPQEDLLSYFNLQTFLKDHFKPAPKLEIPIVASIPVASSSS